MLSHEEIAEDYLRVADTKTEDDGLLVGVQLASKATAHAVLALIDIITGDREDEIQDANQHITSLQNENQALRLRVRELADQLDGCNNTLRRHEQAATANTKPKEDTND